MFSLPPAYAASLRIASTWDGQALPPTEVTTVSLWQEQTTIHLQIDAPFWGDPAPQAPVGSTDQLWEYEVVEVFVAGAAQERGIPYLEMEFSPHGHFLLLRFSAPRQREALHLPCSFRASQEGMRWKGEVKIEERFFPPQPWHWNAYAIHGTPTKRMYCAAAPVKGEKPDFHQPAAFLPLRLDETTISR